ncbi:MAG: hypothetical protein IIB87_08575, partial [Chloroflexi bacterium]|nr:hypothetical protein [Chloroflexota bacterium]
AIGYRISLYTNPEPIREIVSTGPWDLDTAFANIERSFKPAILGRAGFGAQPAEKKEAKES